MKFRKLLISTALMALSIASHEASATYCGPTPPTQTNQGGCDGTGVDFQAILSYRPNNVAPDTITQKDIDIGKQLDLKLSSTTLRVNHTNYNAVLFTIRNIGNIHSSITDVFFDDVDSGALLRPRTSNASSGIGIYDEGSYTDFAMDSALEQLPAVFNGSVYGFYSNFSADTLKGSFDSWDYNRGVNATTNTRSSSEFVTFYGLLSDGKTIGNVIEAINNNTFQIGLNVATYNSTTCKYDFNAYLSENCIAPVPVPTAAWLFGTALLGFVTISNRRRV